MKKILLAPDSFKGTMSAENICGIMEKAIRTHIADAEIVKIPMADGGEGSVDAFLTACGGEKRFVTVKGPFFEEMQSFYGVIEEGKTAMIEMAACAGLPLVQDQLNPLAATTYGVGQLIGHALLSGCEKIILGLGGSATNDGGCGAAAALGVRFLDANGSEFIPVGGTMGNIAAIDTSRLNPRLRNAVMITMCDIDNPLFGEKGAAYIFGPQKGANAETIKVLDAGLIHLDAIVRSDLRREASQLPGAGAAGGMGYGTVVFFQSRLQSGIDTVLDTVKFDTMLAEAGLVFTGEGKIDSQSIRGKVVIGLARRAKNLGVPVIAVVGDVGDGIQDAYEKGVTAVFSINRVAVDFPKAKLRAESDLYHTMDNIMRLIVSGVTL